jgi:cation diffusion facilitator family transporter
MKESKRDLGENMRKLLIRLFIKNHEDIKDPKVRENYGKLAGMVGIVTNALLCALKLGVGFLTNSIAIIADGINNLADASSSVITLIGFKMASKPSDEEHPYGHARIEYLTGLFVSILIILLGIKLLTSSFEKVISPDPLEFKYITIVILAFAIGVKIWQSRFNIKTGEDIRSSTLKATGVDSRNDVIATSAVLLSILIGRFTGIQLDGYMGCIVALFIIYSGIQLIGETSSPLLGKAPDPELVEEFSDDAPHEGNGNEDGHDREGRGHDRKAYLRRAFQRCPHVVLALLQVAHDVFAHDDGVVDEQADGKRQTHEGQHIEGEAEGVHDNKGTDDAYR